MDRRTGKGPSHPSHGAPPHYQVGGKLQPTAPRPVEHGCGGLMENAMDYPYSGNITRIRVAHERRSNTVDLQHPIEDLIPGAQGIVLGLLAATSTPLTGNQLARLSGGRVSQSSVSRVLGTLANSGLVTSVPAGRSVLHEVNRDHVGAHAIQLAVGMRSTLLQRITDTVARWREPADAVWLFGSAARGESTHDSDIDLLVVRDRHDNEHTWQDQIVDLIGSIRSWSGNDCDLLEYSTQELRDLESGSDQLISALRRDAITLHGARPSDHLRTTAPVG